MKRRVAKTMTKPLTKSAKIGARAFEAITAVEGLALGKESRQRLKRLEADASLTPAQRRDAVLRAYATLSRKK